MPENAPFESVEKLGDSVVVFPFFISAKLTVLLAPAVPQELEILVVPPATGKRVPTLKVLFKVAAFTRNGNRSAKVDSARIFFIKFLSQG